jgi:hypothetical protein
VHHQLARAALHVSCVSSWSPETAAVWDDAPRPRTMFGGLCLSRYRRRDRRS